ncbi:MAG: AMP-binding protein, partial [Planctomycetaceae bacterium]
MESTPWVDGLTIGRMLVRTAERFPDHDAVVFPGMNPDGTRKDRVDGGPCFRRTYGEMIQSVDRVAKALIGLGVQKGEHVAVWATNWPRWVLLQYATARIGAVMVNINPAYRAGELAYVLKQSDSVALFLIERFKTSHYFGMAAEAIPELNDVTPDTALNAAEFPKLRHVVSMEYRRVGCAHREGPKDVGGGHSPPYVRDWQDFLALGDPVSDAQLASRAAELQPGDAINIQYTSGTTGFPKGAMLTHRNLLLNAFYVGACQQITDSDRICAPVPFYHCFGCVLAVLCCGVTGAALVIPAEHFHAESTLAAIEAEKATALYGVPTMFIAQLEHATFAGRKLSSLRTGIMAGSPCPIEVMNRVVDDMGAREITIAY